MRAVASWKTVNFAPTVTKHHHGGGVQKDLEQLIQYYKGELTENALLNKAATLAGKKHVLLANPQLPPALVNAQTKPLSHELTKLTKRIRQFPGGVGVGAPGGPPGEEEEEGDLVMGPWNNG